MIPDILHLETTRTISKERTEIDSVFLEYTITRGRDK